jgi:hypothetical protein
MSRLVHAPTLHADRSDLMYVRARAIAHFVVREVANNASMLVFLVLMYRFDCARVLDLACL